MTRTGRGAGQLNTRPRLVRPRRFALTSKDRAESFRFFTLCFFHDTPIPQAQNPFPLLFELGHFFLRFREDIPGNSVHRPFHRSQQLADSLGACCCAGGVSLIALQIGPQLTQPGGLRIRAQANDRYQALRASFALTAYPVPHPRRAGKGVESFPTIRSDAAILLADRFPGV